MAQELLLFATLTSIVPLLSVSVYTGFVTHVHHKKQHKSLTSAQVVVKTSEM